MTRSILAHRKIIKYIDCVCLWSSLIGFFSAAIMGVEFMTEETPPNNNFMASLSFTTAFLTAFKESPWIQRRLKNHHKMLTELRHWNTQFFLGARKYYETKKIKIIQDLKNEYEKNESDRINLELSEDAILGGLFQRITSRLSPDKFEGQYKIKYDRVYDYVNLNRRISDDEDIIVRGCAIFAGDYSDEEPYQVRRRTSLSLSPTNEFTNDIFKDKDETKLEQLF